MPDLHSTPFPAVTGVEFRMINGFPAYCVGSDGSIWSRWILGNPKRFGDKWKRIYGRKAGSGKRMIALYNPSTPPVYQFLHRLVLEAFVGPCPDGCECCHEDDNPANNRLDNLRWDTHAANCVDRDRNGKTARGTRHGSARLTDEDIDAIRAALKRGVIQRVIAVQFHVSRETISGIATGRYWNCTTESSHN